MLPPHHPVVRGEDDHGVLQPPGFLESIDDASHRTVNGLERLQLPRPELIELVPLAPAEHRRSHDPGRLVAHVGLVEGRRPMLRDVFEGLLVLSHHLRGPVRGLGGEVHEQRPIGHSDQPHRFVGEDIGRVVRPSVAVSTHLSVDVQREVLVPGLRECDPVVPTQRHLPLLPRELVVVQVLADENAGVFEVQPGRDGGSVVEGTEAAFGTRVGVDAGGMRVLARQEARARRAAGGVHDEAVVEGDAVVDEVALDDRHRPERVRALVVGDDDDDVRTRVVREARYIRSRALVDQRPVAENGNRQQGESGGSRRDDHRGVATPRVASIGLEFEPVVHRG